MPSLFDQSLNRILLPLAFIWLLCACAPSAQLESGLSANQYRQQAERAIQQKRYPQAELLLQKALENVASAEDLLLLGDLQESLGHYRKAQQSYQRGLVSSPAAATEVALRFHAATLAVLELGSLQEAEQLGQQLPTESAERHNLQTALLLARGKAAAALQQATAVADAGDTAQEMKGWANYHRARAQIALQQRDDAFHSLFLAINNARGHGLVRRITNLWNQLRRADSQAGQATRD